MDHEQGSNERSAVLGTKLATERTNLARERTFAAWMRTALAAAGIGVALAKLLPSVGNRLLVQVAGILFILAAMTILVFALRSYRDVVKEMTARVTGTIPVWVAVVLTVVLVLGSLVGLVSIVLDLG